MSGTFTADQKAIFEGVLNAQRAVYAIAKPGVLWADCHLAAEREIIKALLGLGVLVGDIDSIQAAAVGSVFFPHGLGHLIGCDTHDVGGYACFIAFILLGCLVSVINIINLMYVMSLGTSMARPAGMIELV